MCFYDELIIFHVNNELIKASKTFVDKEFERKITAEELFFLEAFSNSIFSNSLKNAIVVSKVNDTCTNAGDNLSMSDCDSILKNIRKTSGSVVHNFAKSSYVVVINVVVSIVSFSMDQNV